MAKLVLSDLNFNSASKITNLPDPASAQEAATKNYVDNAIEGLAPKDSVRVSTQGNISVASPGATIDGVTMAANDRVLVRAQTAGAENGIYIWNGAAVPMTRALDANTANELEQAVTSVEEGTDANTSWRQTTVNFTLGTTTITWIAFGSSTPSASTTVQGKIQIATQTEVDTGTDALKAVTPLTLATKSGLVKKFSASIGDGSATQYDVTHNLGTLDVEIQVYLNSTGESVIVENKRFSTNVARINFTSAPASNAYRVVVIG